MPVIDLVTTTIPAHTVKIGTVEHTLTSPSKVKVQTTGPGAETQFDEGPASGKQWVVRVSVDIQETNV